MAKGKICRIENCNHVLKYQDGQVCGAHRLRFMRHGNYEISPNWNHFKKGLPQLTKYGYYRVNINGKRVLQHRYIMEQHLGRKLKSSEKVHHKNHIRTDNRIENLELCENQSEHIRKYHHTRPFRYSKETINNILSSLLEKPNVYLECFCGSKVRTRNLCDKHYQWAWKHKFS